MPLFNSCVQLLKTRLDLGTVVVSGEVARLRVLYFGFKESEWSSDIISPDVSLTVNSS